MKQLLLTTALGLGAWGLASAQNESAITRDGAYWVRTIQGSMNAAPGGRLRVETSGNVVLRGNAGEQASYKLTARVKAFDQREAEALLGTILVKTGTGGGGWTFLRVSPPQTGSSGVELTLTAPRALREIWAQTRGGNVEASDWDGDLEAQSGGGQIAVDRIRGRSELRTGGGNIDIGTVGGALRCASGGGTIRVENAGGEAQLETGGGEIFVHEAGGPLQASTGGGNIRVDRAASTVVARTAGGLIQVEQAAGPVTAESSAGAIQVNSSNGVRCESAGGTIRLRDAGGAVRAFANAGSILAELGAGKILRDSVLSTNGGDITVLIPSNLRLTVEATNESGGEGGINSDFPELRPRAPGFPGVGPVVASGALNGGGPMLRVNVAGGTIYLRRVK